MSRSKCSQLVASILKHSASPDLPVLRRVLDNAGLSASHLEAACAVVQFVNEDVAILPDEDLSQKRKRELLSALTGALGMVR